MGFRGSAGGVMKYRRSTDPGFMVGASAAILLMGSSGFGPFTKAPTNVRSFFEPQGCSSRGGVSIKFKVGVRFCEMAFRSSTI